MHVGHLPQNMTRPQMLLQDGNGVLPGRSELAGGTRLASLEGWVLHLCRVVPPSGARRHQHVLRTPNSTIKLLALTFNFDLVRGLIGDCWGWIWGLLATHSLHRVVCRPPISILPGAAGCGEEPRSKPLARLYPQATGTGARLVVRQWFPRGYACV